MERFLSSKDRERIEQGIRTKYVQVAVDPRGRFRYPTGRRGMERLGYDPEILNMLPESVLSSYCGVGNPFSLGPVQAGDSVLDIGCGGGVDALVAARYVGAEGRVVGIDPVPEMLERAERNLREADVPNVEFRLASAEKLPFPDHSFDLVISNGVFNLVPGKREALREVRRVLKPGGRFYLADQIRIGAPKQERAIRISDWFQWVGGSVPGREFLAMLEEAGFEDAEWVGNTGMDSSPETRAALFRAVRPGAFHSRPETRDTEEPLEAYRRFFDGVYGEGRLSRKVKYLVALGASLAAACEP